MARHHQAEAFRTDLLGLLEASRPLPDDAAVRSRATMWDVVRFAEHHLYRAIVVENVVEAADVDDVSFRMLSPQEITAAMAFPADYIIKGSKRERIRQASNAVTPPTAKDIIAAIMGIMAI